MACGQWRRGGRGSDRRMEDRRRAVVRDLCEGGTGARVHDLPTPGRGAPAGASAGPGGAHRMGGRRADALVLETMVAGTDMVVLCWHGLWLYGDAGAGPDLPLPVRDRGDQGSDPGDRERLRLGLCGCGIREAMSGGIVKTCGMAGA